MAGWPNRINISQGLAGAAQGISQALSIKAQQQLEEMRDMRAENLARLQYGRESGLVSQRGEIEGRLQHERLGQEGALETQREIALATRQDVGGQQYMDRLLSAQKAERESQTQRESAASEAQRRTQVAQNRLQMFQQLDAIDAEKSRLNAQIQAAVHGNIMISTIQDPAKRQAAMAADPVVGPLLEQYNEIEQRRSKTTTAYTLFGASLGDPMFQGKQTSELDQSGAAGGAGPSLIQGATSGAPQTGARTDNPLETPQNYSGPGYPEHNPADDAPAIVPSGSQPGSVPMTATPPMLGPRPAAQTTMMGPLKQPPQLIPQQLSQIGNPMGAPPSLIPQGQ